jgi:serine/threonine protein kinase
LIEAIGVGGMAAVLRARDTQLDRIVALKILPPEMANDPENVQRFHQEARSAAKLDHENIARVFFCGEDQRLHFIAFEFVEGDNLRTLLERRGRLPVGEALHYMLQVSAGLAHASARGVVHRDIKPSNIIITPNGRAKLVDMGLARCLETKAEKGLTQSGVTLGTFDYISPEQALEPRDADVRSDIYSLGCTFYHMITGVAPVPEGTAAKKLHHHQHVKPTDPRELAPNIPDEVAMILARMMAKNPRDRYQTPEFLVHDLLRAARKLGVGGDVPEGVLAVEASLPRPTSYRPMLIVAAAAVAVIAVILLAVPSLAPTSNNKETRNNPLPKDNGDGAGTQPKKTDKGDIDQHPADGTTDTKHEEFVFADEDFTAADLARWLKVHEDADKLVIQLAHDLDVQVNNDSEPRLIVKAKKVIIRPKNPERVATIRLSYAGLAKLSPHAALTIDSKDATVEGIRVVLDGYDSQGAMTGLLIQGQSGGHYGVRQCEFVQVRDKFDDQLRMASVVLDTRSAGSDAMRTLLTLNQCAFLGFDSLRTELQLKTFALQVDKPGHGGQDAIVRRGSGRIEATHCAIGPHVAAFRFEGGAGQDSAAVTHCSVMAGHGSTAAFFDFHDDASTLDVRYSLLARSGDNGDAFLIRQNDRQSETHSTAIYNGEDNRYYNLEGFWAGDSREEKKYDDFVHKLKDKVGELFGQDERSRVLAEPPWNDESPLAALDDTRYFVQFDATHKLPEGAQKRNEEQLKEAFQIKLDQRELRRGGDPSKSLIGVESLGHGIRYTANLPPLDEKKTDPTMRRTLVVDPSAGGKGGTYDSLKRAVFDATKPGDIIVIRHKGELPVDPISLEKSTIDLTIRPDTDAQPILVIGDTRERDASLFRLLDGKLRLEGLEFRVQPSQDEFRSQCVATVVGDGQCTFKDCVITLNPAGQKTHLAAVSLADNSDVMKMKVQPPGTVSQQPHLVFDNCFMRGNGDLIWSRISRPFDLELTNSVVALQEGNVLNIEVAETAPAVMPPPTVNATINHTTAYLSGTVNVSGYFIRLKAGKELKGLVPLQCRSTGSLFVAAAGQTFIHLEGPAANEDRLKEKLPWSGEQNVYAGYTDMLAQQPIDVDARPPVMDQDHWKKFTNDTTSKYPTMVKFTTPPGDTPFIRMTPGMFKPMEVAAGADVQTMPKPHADDH